MKLERKIYAANTRVRTHKRRPEVVADLPRFFQSSETKPMIVYYRVILCTQWLQRWSVAACMGSARIDHQRDDHDSLRYTL